MAENRVIGRDNAVPWHLPADLRHFRHLTLGHPVIMGRKTFDSIARRPLAGRRNIVLSRDPAYRPAGVEVVDTLERALELVRGEDEVFVVGGAELYRRALPLADRLYLTLVHAQVGGDVRFPQFELAEWRLVEEERHAADERHPFAFTFRRYDRRSTAA
jgi:dihydrofolate reductase